MFLQIHNFHTFFFRLEEREGEVGEVAMQVGELATQEVGEEALELNQSTNNNSSRKSPPSWQGEKLFPPKRLLKNNMGGFGRSLMVSWKLIRLFVASAAMSRSSGILPQTRSKGGENLEKRRQSMTGELFAEMMFLSDTV